MLHSQKNILTALVTGFVTLTLLTSCVDESFEFQQEMTVIGTLSITEDAFSSPPGTRIAQDEEATLGFGVDFLLTQESPVLIEYRDEDLFREFQITSFNYKVLENSMNTDLESIEFAMGKLGVENINEPEVIVMGAIPAVPAGATPEGRGDLFQDNARPAALHAFDLDFGTTTGTRINLNAGDIVPRGRIRVEIKLVVTYIAYSL